MASSERYEFLGLDVLLENDFGDWINANERKTISKTEGQGRKWYTGGKHSQWERQFRPYLSLFTTSRDTWEEMCEVAGGVVGEM